MSQFFKKHIALPQDHGAWVFILSPLAIGLYAAGTFTLDSFFLMVAAMAAFFLRQPLTVLVKVAAGRRPRTEFSTALFWASLYALIALAGLIGLIYKGYFDLLYLVIPGMIVFGWHLWLVSRRAERRQAGVEIIATGVLALAAPAAYWVGLGRYEPTGWWLWLLVWLQSAASIVYAYFRLEQRETAAPAGTDRDSARENKNWLPIISRLGWRAILYTSFNLLFSLGLSLSSILPPLIFLPFLLQWLESIWGAYHPAYGWKPTRIGLRQLVVSTMWTLLFMLTWRF